MQLAKSRSVQDLCKDSILIIKFCFKASRDAAHRQLLSNSRDRRVVRRSPPTRILGRQSGWDRFFEDILSGLSACVFIQQKSGSVMTESLLGFLLWIIGGGPGFPRMIRLLSSRRLIVFVNCADRLSGNWRKVVTFLANFV